jgi:putative peptidoglycan lipid II flippase
VTYYDPLELQKDGVGLLLDLGKPVKVSEVSVSFVGSPTSFDVLAADKAAAEPTSTEGLTRVGGQKDAGAKADVTLDKPVTTRYLAVWLTSLPSASGGYVGQVAEIVVR